MTLRFSALTVFIVSISVALYLIWAKGRGDPPMRGYRGWGGVVAYFLAGGSLLAWLATFVSRPTLLIAVAVMVVIGIYLFLVWQRASRQDIRSAHSARGAFAAAIEFVSAPIKSISLLPTRRVIGRHLEPTERVVSLLYGVASDGRYVIVTTEHRILAFRYSTFGIAPRKKVVDGEFDNVRLADSSARMTSLELVMPGGAVRRIRIPVIWRPEARALAEQLRTEG